MAQIGTVKVETPSGIKSLPVFAEADSGSSVYEMVKVKTPSGIGFIPMVKNSGDATFPYVKVQTANQGIVHAHDAASLITVVDDFEDGNLTEYSSTGGFDANQNAPVANGSYSLKLINDTNANFMNSTSGLNAYPARGDTFRFNVQIIDNTALPQTFFAWADTNNYYRIDLDDRNDPGAFNLIVNSGGSSSTIASASESFTTGIWYEVEVQWSDPTITATLFDNDDTQVAQISGDDTTFDSGGIAFRGGQTNDDQAWDYFRITG